MRAHVGGARAAEAVNGLLTAGLLALFCAVVFQGAQQADFASLTRVADWHAAPACVPIIFLSLVRLPACPPSGCQQHPPQVSLVHGSI